MSGTVDAFSLPPEQAIAFFRQKVNMPTRAWDDLRHGAHARAWSVAGVQAHDMLAEIRTTMDRAIAEGRTLDQFRADMQPLLQDLGWADRGPGYVGWRTRTVYETNMRTAYAAGRYAQMTDPDVLALRPFWRYRHSGKKDARPQHRDWDGLVLRHDDAFWQTHFPPNGWGCGCYVQSVGERARDAAAAEGKDEAPSHGARPFKDPRTGEIHELPAGIDPGWDYNVGRSWLHGTVPQEMARPLPPPRPPAAPAPDLPPMPPARPVDPSRRLPDGLTPTEYAEAFLREFGATMERSVVMRDVTGTRIVIGRDLFTAFDGTLKADKTNRGPSMLLLADALRDPDEVWLDWAFFGTTFLLRRRYLRRSTMSGNSNPLSVFEWTAHGWSGVTTYPERDSQSLNERHGVMIYRRPNDADEG